MEWGFWKLSGGVRVHGEYEFEDNTLMEWGQ